ncbi:MAG: DUF411 domain-containing protein [Alphaproteobacteria bacterium]
MRAIFALLVAVGLLAANHSSAAEAKTAQLYKNPECGCCEGHASVLRQSGFEVEVINTHDLPLIKRQHGVAERYEGCHTTLVGGYVVEGHVPAGVIERLLAEKPRIRGISLPGMPSGSPGMAGSKTEPLVIYEIADGPARVYAVE